MCRSAQPSQAHDELSILVSGRRDGRAGARRSRLTPTVRDVDAAGHWYQFVTAPSSLADARGSCSVAKTFHRSRWDIRIGAGSPVPSGRRIGVRDGRFSKKTQPCRCQLDLRSSILKPSQPTRSSIDPAPLPLGRGFPRAIISEAERFTSHSNDNALRARSRSTCAEKRGAKRRSAAGAFAGPPSGLIGERPISPSRRWHRVAARPRPARGRSGPPRRPGAADRGACGAHSGRRGCARPRPPPRPAP